MENKPFVIDLTKLKQLNCKNKECQGKLFVQVYECYHVSELLSPDGRRRDLLVPRLQCVNCGQIHLINP